MYKGFIRPILFLIDPERIHHLIVFLLRIINSVPFAGNIIRNCLNYRHPLLKTTVAGLTFNNKVGMAAGFDKNADFYDDLTLFGFSFIEIGTVTPMPQPGNPKPRLFRLPKDKALINRMGFNNKGCEYAAHQLAKRKSRSVMIGGNIGKNTATLNENAPDDYLKCFITLYDVVDYFTVNVSCPNIKDLGKLQDQDSLRVILDMIMKERSLRQVYKPVFIKISPDLTFKQIDETIALCFETCLDGIIATNTTTDRNCLNTENDLINRYGSGGLSGHPLKERSLEIIRYICKQSENRLPVIGVGGIITEVDAIDMIKAGASLVQVYTGFIYEGPLIVRRINKALAQYLTSNLDIDNL